MAQKQKIKTKTFTPEAMIRVYKCKRATSRRLSLSQTPGFWRSNALNLTGLPALRQIILLLYGRGCHDQRYLPTKSV